MAFILSLILFFPILTALIALFIKNKIKVFALGAALIEFLLTFYLWFNYNSEISGMQFIEKYNIYENFGISYYLGVDGISLFLIILTAFIMLLSIYFLEEGEDLKSSIVILLFLETIFMGLFLSLDSLFLYAFWELMLLPIILSINSWKNRKAKITFFIYSFFSSLLFILSILAIAYLFYKQTNKWSFEIVNFYPLIIESTFSNILFFTLFIAFILKVPLFPFYSWLKNAYKESLLSGSLILFTLMFIVPFYLIIRVVFPIVPNGVINNINVVLIFSFFIVLYALFEAVKKRDIKELIYYSIFFYVALEFLYIFILEKELFTIAIILLFIYSILVVNQLFLSYKIINIMGVFLDENFFLIRYIPKLSIVFILNSLLFFALPLIFLYEFNFLNFNNYKNLTIFALTAFFGAIAFIVTIKFIFLNLFKKVGQKVHPAPKDLNFKDILVSSLLLILLLAILLYPKNIIKPIEVSSKALIDFMEAKAKRVESLKMK